MTTHTVRVDRSAESVKAGALAVRPVLAGPVTVPMPTEFRPLSDAAGPTGHDWRFCVAPMLDWKKPRLSC